MKQVFGKKIRNVFAVALMGSTLLLGGCGTILDQRGHVAQAGAIEDISVGLPRTEVVDILGSPSVITKSGGLSYYYISSLQSRFNILGNKEKERNVVAVHFRNNRVIKVAHYGLQDGVVVDFIAKTTPTYKKDLNFIQEIFGNVGRFTPNVGGSGVNDGLGSL